MLFQAMWMPAWCLRYQFTPTAMLTQELPRMIMGEDLLEVLEDEAWDALEPEAPAWSISKKSLSLLTKTVLNLCDAPLSMRSSSSSTGLAKRFVTKKVLLATNANMNIQILFMVKWC